MLKKYDQRCEDCGWQGEIVSDTPIARDGTQPLCPACGYETERYYNGGYGFIGDEIVGGQVIENLGHEPVRVDSKSELRRIAASRGLEQRVRHVPLPGSDKSPNTTRWV